MACMDAGGEGMRHHDIVVDLWSAGPAGGLHIRSDGCVCRVLRHVLLCLYAAASFLDESRPPIAQLIVAVVALSLGRSRGMIRQRGQMTAAVAACVFDEDLAADTDADADAERASPFSGG